jgi:hypothetical protein
MIEKLCFQKRNVCICSDGDLYYSVGKIIVSLFFQNVFIHKDSLTNVWACTMILGKLIPKYVHMIYFLIITLLGSQFPNFQIELSTNQRLLPKLHKYALLSQTEEPVSRNNFELHICAI